MGVMQQIPSFTQLTPYVSPNKIDDRGVVIKPMPLEIACVWANYALLVGISTYCMPSQP